MFDRPPRPSMDVPSSVHSKEGAIREQSGSNLWLLFQFATFLGLYVGIVGFIMCHLWLS